MTYYQNDTPILCENKIEKISGVYYDSELEAVEKSQQTVLNYSRNKIVQDNSVGTPEVIYTKNHSSYSGKNVEFVYIQNNTERNWNIIKEYEYKRYPNMPDCITLPNKETMIRHLGLNSTNQRSEETFEYDYDSLERINKDVHKVNNNSMYEKYYTYDVLNRIVREDNLGFGKTYTYEYDIYGNIINKKEYNYTRDTNLSSPTKTYNYIYHTTSDENKNPHMLKEYDGNLITYDNQNRMISYTTTTNSKQFVWDNRNMVQYAYNGTTLTFLYDTNGIRTNKIIEGNNQTIEIKYITNGNKIIKETRSNGIELTYLHFNNEIVGFIYNNDYYMFYKNITGDIVAILNNNNVVARYKYDAWGNHTVYNPDGTINTNSTFIGNINPIRYKTYYYDQETQLFYCNSRYYSPELCRWISPDSIEYLDPESINGLNLYCYCMNNPIMYADPSGHFTIAAMLISVGLSLAFEFVGDLIDGNGIDHSLREYIGAGVSGLFGGLGGGFGAQIVFSVAGGIIDSWISGELNGDNMGQVLFNIGVSTVLSSVAGHLGGKLASKLKGNSLAKLGRHEIKNSMKNLGLKFSLNKNGTSAKELTKFLNKDTSVWLGKIVGEYGMASTVSGLYSLLPF